MTIADTLMYIKVTPLSQQLIIEKTLSTEIKELCFAIWIKASLVVGN